MEKTKTVFGYEYFVDVDTDIVISTKHPKAYLTKLDLQAMLRAIEIAQEPVELPERDPDDEAEKLAEDRKILNDF